MKTLSIMDVYQAPSSEDAETAILLIQMHLEDDTFPIATLP